MKQPLYIFIDGDNVKDVKGLGYFVKGEVI